MKLQCVVAILLSLGSSVVLSETQNPFLGNWKVTWESKKDKMMEAKVVIEESGGTWQTLEHYNRNPCAGMKAPILIQSSSQKAMKIEVKYSELHGCSDYHIKLTAEDGVVTGTHGEENLVFTKQ